MREIQFSIGTRVTKEKAKATLCLDKSLHDWACIIDEGANMKGMMKEGNGINFIVSINGNGITRFIEKLKPNEIVLLR